MIFTLCRNTCQIGTYIYISSYFDLNQHISTGWLNLTHYFLNTQWIKETFSILYWTSLARKFLSHLEKLYLYLSSISTNI